MLSVLEVAELAKNIAILAGTRPEARPQAEPLAVQTLAALKAHSGILGLAEYDGKIATLIGADPSRTEPWVAFLSGGPGKPPPAVALLRPPGGAPGAWDTIFDVFTNWTGPGQMYKILSGQGLPTSGLLDAMKSAMGDAVDLIEKPVTQFLNTVLVVVSILGGTAVILGGMYLISLRTPQAQVPARREIQRHERRV